MVEGLHLHRRATLCVCACMLLWAASECAGLYFYARDYYSWAANVLLFQDTSISKRNGWLQLNPYQNFTIGRALYKNKFQIQNTLNNSVASFNTSFIFSMNTDRGKDFFGDGLTFLICPGRFAYDNYQVSSGGYLGMFNATTMGLSDNRIFAVEFDTHQNPPFHDPNDNHVGVDINSLHSLRTRDLYSLGIVLNEGRKIICWIDYDGSKRYLWVYLALSPSTKPVSPVIAMDLDLSPYMRNNAYVGFTSATGARAELHTIHSWWFLSGFGNLTFPTSPPSPSPLARLGERSVVITVFTLAVVVGFLCLFCFLAWRQWQKESQHLIDVFLPVACWMYWKESITQEVRIKLTKPTLELLAWLWRTRWVRRQSQPLTKTWMDRLLRSKMGPLHKGGAWQLVDKRQTHIEPCSPLQGPAHEEPEGKSGSAADTQPRVKKTKDNQQKPLLEKKMKDTNKKRKGSPGKAKPVGPMPARYLDFEGSGMQGKAFEPRLKNFRISNASFIIMDEESQAQLADVPVVTLSDGQSQLKDVGMSTAISGVAGEPSPLKRETVTEDYADGPSHKRRESFSAHKGDDVGSTDVKALEEGGKVQAFIHVEDEDLSSSSVLIDKPGADAESGQSSDMASHETEAKSEPLVGSPPHLPSSGDSGSESHATQPWLFD